MTTSSQRLSLLLVFTFISVVIFLFFHLYTKPPKQEVADPLADIPKLSTPTLSVINPSQGPTDAQVTLVMFGDFQCEACRDAALAIDGVRRAFREQVRVVWKDLPNESLHAEATNAAIAARCANEQGAFWPYHDRLFANMNTLSDSTYTAIAESLRLNLNTFARCRSSKSPLPRIQKDFEEAIGLSLTATPTLFINNERITGSLTEDQLRARLEPLLSPSL